MDEQRLHVQHLSATNTKKRRIGRQLLVSERHLLNGKRYLMCRSETYVFLSFVTAGRMKEKRRKGSDQRLKKTDCYRKSGRHVTVCLL